MQDNSKVLAKKDENSTIEVKKLENLKRKSKIIIKDKRSGLTILEYNN